MGKLILCSGERTSRPYSFSSNGVRVYSIEELCYYLYNHVYIIDESLLKDDLFDWIQTELKLPERAQKLKQLKRQKADLKTIVTVILCSADYYSEYEIKNFLKTLDTVIGMPMIKRNRIKADGYLKNRDFKAAADEYVRILYSKEAAELSPEEYGDIYHNLAAAKVHTSGLKEASRLFREAYERNHREDSLKQYLYTILMCNPIESFHEKAEELHTGEELKNSILGEYQQMEKEADSSEQMQVMEDLRKRKVLGKVNEFYARSQEMMDGWKTEIRQI